MQERLNEEIRRRERVIRIFDEASAMRLRSTASRTTETRITGSKYFDMEKYFEWKGKHSELFQAKTKTLSVLNGKS